MLLKFQLKQNSLEVCQTIIDHHPEISTLTLIAHEVNINWRQRYPTVLKKITKLADGFYHDRPIKIKKYSRQKFQQLTLNTLPNLEKNQVWSITSKIECFDSAKKHFPMMNFHPENITTRDIKKILAYVCGSRPGVLLESGRFQHYYGDFLLSEPDWLTFMAEFLMPTCIVSPRYIGHRLYDGYCTLRLTSEQQYKPKIPTVIALL